MKYTLVRSILLTALMALSCSHALADGNVWVVRCDPSTTPSADPLATDLKSYSVSVRRLRLDRGPSRDSLCGSSGALVGALIPPGDRDKALQVPGVAEAPESFGTPPRRTH